MDRKKYAGILLNIAVPIVTLYLICFWGPRLLAFFLPFVIGWLIAMIANPLIRLLERKLRIVRRTGSVLLIVVVLGLVISGCYLLANQGIRALTGFAKELPEFYEAIQAEIIQAAETLGSRLNFVPAETETAILEVVYGMGDYVGSFLQELAASAGGAVAKTIPDVFVSTIVVILSSYLFLAEHDRLVSAVLAFLPKSVRKYWQLFKKDIRGVIGGYFLAQFKIMLVVGLILLAGFFFLKVRYFVFVAIVIAFLDFLPMFGTGTAMIPWAFVKVCTGEYSYALWLMIIWVTTQAVRQIIQPKIVGDSMGVPPLTTLFLLFVGYKCKGIGGMILAIPAGIIFIKFYEYGAFDSFLENVRLLWEEIRKLRGKP